MRKIVKQYEALIDYNLSATKNAQKIARTYNLSFAEHENLRRGIGEFFEELKKKLEPVTIENCISDLTVMVVPDLHLPYELEGYYEFLKQMYNTYKPNKVVFIGDIIDGHTWSFHTPSLRAKGTNAEFEEVRDAVKKYQELFPNAIWILGNHDILPSRKATEHRIPEQMFKQLNDALGVTWDIRSEIVIDGVYYVHGEGSTATNRAMIRQLPTVQGHRHSECYIKYINDRLWGMQVGIAFDKQKYAFAYAKETTQSWVSGVGIIKNKIPSYIPYVLHKER